MKPLDVFDLLPRSLSWMGEWAHPFYPLGLLAFLVSLFAAFLFKRFSDQRALAEVRREIEASYMELILNRGFFGELLCTQGRLLTLNLRYIRHALPAILVIVVPVVMVLNSFDSFFAYRPVKTGEIFSITAKGPDARKITALTGEMPEGIRLIEIDPLLGRAVFRALEDGTYRIPLKAGSADFTKTVVVGNGIDKLLAVKKNTGWMDALYTYDPGSLPDGVESVVIDYVPLQSPVSFFGWRPNWIWFFIIISFVPIVFLKKIFDIN